MAVPMFDPKEITEAKTISFGGRTQTIFNYPCSQREGILATYRREPYWTVSSFTSMFSPKVNPDNIARGFVYEAGSRDMKVSDFGGPDMFGIEWEYIESVGGSMVRPGKPYIEDANEIKDKIVFPDVDKWDWEGSAEANKAYLRPENANCMWFLNGWYERLISFMDFEGAIMALIDEDQQDAVHEFFGRLSDLYIKILDHAIKAYPQIDMFCIHDDWGSQKETFFAPAVAEEMIVPYMKVVTDFLHSKGKYCDFHCCGNNMKQIPNMIKAGWDSWCPQAMNDTAKEYELYGDKIIIGVMPKAFDPKTAPEEEQRASARDFVDRFMQPGKPATINFNAMSYLTPAFNEELYEYSRKKCCGMI